MGAPAQDMRRPAQLQAEFLHGKSGQALELPKGVVAIPSPGGALGGTACGTQYSGLADEVGKVGFDEWGIFSDLNHSVML